MGYLNKMIGETRSMGASMRYSTQGCTGGGEGGLVSPKFTPAGLN